MVHVLRPRIYASNLEWSLLPKNKIDTVSMSPYLNKTATQVMHVQELTSGLVNGVEVTLPMSNAMRNITDYEIMSNSRSTALWSSVMGSAAVYLSTIQGSYTVHLTVPPATTPRAVWSLEGTTEYTQRGVATVETIDANTGLDVIANYITNNKAGTEDIIDNKSTDNYNRANLASGLLVNYNQGWVPLFPWIRDTTGSPPSNMLVYEYLQSRYRPREENILTTWNNDESGSDWLPQFSGWNTYNQTGAVRQGPYRWLASSSTDNIPDRFIPIVNKKYRFKCNVKKLNDYDYQVDYDLPVRYMYIAGAKAVDSVWHNNVKGQDSYAFKDVISKITIELVSGTFTDDTNDLSYSLEDSQLTEDAANEHILTFAKNELITMQTKWGDDLWTQKMSKTILDKLKDGKYVVKCSVPASWAIQNRITINSQMNVQLQNGEYITRNGFVSVFEVKNIEKRFQNNSFTYELQMLEV